MPTETDQFQQPPLLIFIKQQTEDRRRTQNNNIKHIIFYQVLKVLMYLFCSNLSQTLNSEADLLHTKNLNLLHTKRFEDICFLIINQL